MDLASLPVGTVSGSAENSSASRSSRADSSAAEKGFQRSLVDGPSFQVLEGWFKWEI